MILLKLNETVSNYVTTTVEWAPIKNTHFVHITNYSQMQVFVNTGKAGTHTCNLIPLELAL
jgi:hypothetical protein